MSKMEMVLWFLLSLYVILNEWRWMQVRRLLRAALSLAPIFTPEEREKIKREARS